MNEIEPVTEKPSTDVLAGAWSVDRHLSPLALFDPNRSAICAQYQLALVDDSSNEARAHIAAARRHLQAAMKSRAISSGSTRHPIEFLRSVCGELDTISHGWD